MISAPFVAKAASEMQASYQKRNANPDRCFPGGQSGNLFHLSICFGVIQIEAGSMYRSRKHRIIAGVCGGIAERYHMSPTTVRLLALLSCLLPGPQFIIYIVIWILVPKAPEQI
jgi:phage shock protein C